MRNLRLFALVLIAAGIVAQRSGASDGNPGRVAYFRYCASCHGMDGKGGGVVAGALRPPLPDLTKLAKGNGGTFPYAQVQETIDGRKPVMAHGNRQMPVWGKVFAEEKTFEQPASHARAQVQIITDYLSTIQTP